MKNLAFALFLASVFAFSATSIFAGDIPHVGRTCPPNTTCATDGQIPIGGLSSGNTQENEPTIFKTLLDYLARMFG